MQSHFIKELIGIKDIEVLDIQETKTHLEIMITTEPKEHTCPSCGETTKRIHDYRRILGYGRNLTDHYLYSVLTSKLDFSLLTLFFLSS